MPSSDIKLELSYDQLAHNVLAELKQRFLVRIVSGGKENAPKLMRGQKQHSYAGKQVWIIEWKGGRPNWGIEYEKEVFKTNVPRVDFVNYSEDSMMIHIKHDWNDYLDDYFNSDGYMDTITSPEEYRQPLPPVNDDKPWEASDYKLAAWEIELLEGGLDSPETEDVKPKPKPPTKR